MGTAGRPRKRSALNCDMQAFTPRAGASSSRSLGLGSWRRETFAYRDRWEHPIEVRKTPLYDLALLFRFGASAG